MNNPFAMMEQIQNIQKVISGNDPNKMFDYLLKNNPQFAKFIEVNKGKTPEQIAKENGIDFSVIKQFLK